VVDQRAEQCAQIDVVAAALFDRQRTRVDESRV